ncbi:hypothetical protein TNCV_3594591 [Trichonephila clavipes]|nr:hypothetical protein TNCV_3594591 [Trichonephila clavipes]
MSSFLGFCEGDTRNRWRDGQVCLDVDKELWRLGPDGSGDRRKEKRGEEKDESPGERTGGKKRRKVGRGGRGDPGERTDGRSEGVRDWSEKDDERRWR